MNAKNLIAAVLTVTAAAGALAQEATPSFPELNQPGTRTRAEVRAELDQARAQGTLVVFTGEAEPKASQPAPTATRLATFKSRDGSGIDAAQARRENSVLFSGEPTPFPELQQGSVRSREAVRNEGIANANRSRATADTVSVGG